MNVPMNKRDKDLKSNVRQPYSLIDIRMNPNTEYRAKEGKILYILEFR